MLVAQLLVENNLSLRIKYITFPKVNYRQKTADQLISDSSCLIPNFDIRWYLTSVGLNFLENCKKILPYIGSVRYGDSLQSLLCNVAFQRVIRDSVISSHCHLFSKPTRLLVFDDDFDIAAKTLLTVREVFLVFKIVAHRMGLIIDSKKTKYITLL